MLTLPSTPDPSLTETAVRLGLVISTIPMTAGAVLEALFEETKRIPVSPHDFRRRNLALAAYEHLCVGQHEMALRDVTVRRQITPPATAGNSGGPGREMSMAVSASHGGRPYIGYEADTELVWGCGDTLGLAQAMAGHALIEAGRPERFEHLRFRPAGPGMIEAWETYGADVPWTTNLRNEAIPEPAWNVAAIRACNTKPPEPVPISLGPAPVRGVSWMTI